MVWKKEKISRKRIAGCSPTAREALGPLGQELLTKIKVVLVKTSLEAIVKVDKPML